MKHQEVMNHQDVYPCRTFLEHDQTRNALIQPHHDYACSAWYPSLGKRLSKKFRHPRTNVLDIA